MLISPTVESLLNKNVENRYELVMEVSKRARQIINDGSKEIRSKVTMAAEEVSENKCFIIRDDNKDIKE